jgi:hypothetical protein
MDAGSYSSELPAIFGLVSFLEQLHGDPYSEAN